MDWADFSAKFEMRRHGTGEVIQGGISMQALARISAEGLEPYHKHFRAHMKVGEVAARNRQPKIAYTLLSLESVATPAGWADRAAQTVML